MNKRSLLRIESQVKSTKKEEKIDLSKIPTKKLKEMLKELESQEKETKDKVK